MTEVPARPDKPKWSEPGPTRRRVIWIGLAVIVVLSIVASQLDGGSRDGGGGTSSDSVDWENYSPDVKARIDGMETERDCIGLQAEFDTADANDDAQRDRVGEGNADLMAYIDQALESAGCYS